MKKIITPTTHAAIDYLVVAALAATPEILNFSLNVSIFTFVLAAVHLLLTMTTDAAGGMFKLVPFKVHGFVELFVGAGLAMFSFFAELDSAERYFYYSFSCAVLVVWTLTDYQPSASTKNSA